MLDILINRAKTAFRDRTNPQDHRWGWHQMAADYGQGDLLHDHPASLDLFHQLIDKYSVRMYNKPSSALTQEQYRSLMKVVYSSGEYQQHIASMRGHLYGV
jgi:hypothetical protein